jgi:hypothetical protein
VGQQVALDQRSLGGMIVVLIGIGRSLVKGFVKEIIVMREPVNAHMTGLVIVIQEKKSTTTEIMTGLGTGSEERIGKEIMVVIVIVVTEIGTRIVVVTTIQKRTVVALMIGIVRGAGNGREIMNEIVVTCMRGVLTMLMVGSNMTKECQIMDRIMAMACTSNTKAMSPMTMVKMDVGVKLSTQRGMSMVTIMWTHAVRWNPVIRCSLTMLNLMALRKVRHSRKVTTSIIRQLNA